MALFNAVFFLAWGLWMLAIAGGAMQRLVAGGMTLPYRARLSTGMARFIAVLATIVGLVSLLQSWLLWT